MSKQISPLSTRRFLIGILGLAAALSIAPTARPQEAARSQETEISEAMQTQISLARANFSPGVIDGRWGSNTRSALRAFQKTQDLDVTGDLDQASRNALGFDGQKFLVDYTLTKADLAGPFIDKIPDELPAQADLDRLAYTSAEEALAERFHLSEDALRSLNPEVTLEAGATLRIPNLTKTSTAASTSSDTESPQELRIVVSRTAESLELRNEEDQLIFFAPVTAGSKTYPLPIGTFEVETVTTEPTYHYDPELIKGADLKDPEASLPPGPNGPVGLVWIGINKEHYGIHGTPEPSEIGYDASSGCVRMTNWDALHLAHLVSAGTQVIFEE